MEQLLTITEVSKFFGISTRTLRYYEQVGLITPVKKEDFAYRNYTAETVTRLRQIIILRKLRIPLKQIADILKSADARVAIEAFEQNLTEVEEEITALSTIRGVIKAFIAKLNLSGEKFLLPEDESLMEIVDALTVSKINFKEEKSMSELNKASGQLTKLSDVRIVHLPPMTVAAASVIGEDCEGKSAEMLNDFVRKNDLLRVKPDLRFFGFDCSQGKTGMNESSYKYQSWVSIPGDLDVPAPLVKRHFTGGLYAAHMITMGNFDHWALLYNWVTASDKYANDWASNRCSPMEADMERCLEEELNYWGNVQNPQFDNNDTQFDLLFPVRLK